MIYFPNGPLAAAMPTMWKIVGGADKGGIMVREGQELGSPLCQLRLSTGSAVEELALASGRLNYRLCSGTGPVEGWISVALTGKVLAVRVPGGEAEPTAMNLGPGMPAEDCPWTEAFPWSKLLKDMSMTQFGAAVTELFERRQGKCIGYFYEMEFPYTLEMIQGFGPTWLTSALHSAGTLPADNRVVEYEARGFVGGGACLKAVITCKFEKPSEDLHEKLFCKYPFPVKEETFPSLWEWICMRNNDAPEIDFARLLSAAAPMRTAKYYFGDICPKTGLNILITECLDFPEEHADFGPFELEPIPHKAVDYLLDDPFAYYNAIVRNAARLAAAGFNGKFGRDALRTFGEPEIPSMFALGVKTKIPKFLHFAREVPSTARRLPQSRRLRKRLQRRLRRRIKFELGHGAVFFLQYVVKSLGGLLPAACRQIVVGMVRSEISTAGQSYTTKAKGKKLEEHGLEESDLRKLAALILTALADSSKDVNPDTGKSDFDILYSFAEGVTSPMILQGKVLHCKLVKTFKSKFRKLQINVHSSLEAESNAFSRVLALKGFKEEHGKDARGSLARDIEKLRWAALLEVVIDRRLRSGGWGRPALPQAG